MFSGATGTLVYPPIIGDPGISGGYNALAPGGDFDGDGITDLLVAQGAGNAASTPTGNPGRVVVYSGADGRRLFELQNPTGIDPSGFGKGATALFDALAGGVDLNDDGVPDILVGAPWAKQAILFLIRRSW